jgi:hypothetical protein
MKKLIVLIFIAFSLNVNSQCGIDWLKYTEGDAETQFYGLLSDSSNNILAWGEVDYGSTGFNYGSINIPDQGGQRGILLKTDENGNELWAKSFISASDYCAVNSAVTNSNNEVYALVYGMGALTLNGYGPISPLTNNKHVSIVKFSSEGNYIWHKTISSTSAVSINIIQVNNRLFISGSFRDNLTLADSTHYTSIIPFASNTDFFIAKLDTSGNLINSKFFGSNGSEGSGSFSIGGNGDLIVTTMTSATDLNIDGNIINNPSGENFNIIASFDSLNFSSNWVKYIHNNPNLGFKSYTSENDIYITGGFGSGHIFPPYVFNTPSGTGGAFIAKMDLLGNVAWVKSAISNSWNNIIINDIKFKDGFIYTSMDLKDTFNFNGTYIGNTWSDYYNSMAFVKFDSNGEFISMLLESDSSNICYADGIALNRNGDLIVSGHFKKKFNFSGYDIQFSNPVSNLGYGWNELIAKICPEFFVGLPDSKKNNLLKVFPNPISDKFTINYDGELKVSEIRVVDNSGRTRILLNSFDSKHEIDISALENNFYILKVTFENGSQVCTKLIKIED